jgi:predicted methyltransferase
MKSAMINFIQNEKVDDYYTPEYAVTPLLQYIPKGITVWECCDIDERGGSQITQLLKKHGCKVISTGKAENFLTYKPKEDFDMIITNPPYSLKDKFIERCYELKKPFCLLLPITAIEGRKRGEMYRKHGIQLLIFDRRIEFINNKKGNWFNSSWFCWKVLPESLIFKELKKEKTKTE